MAHFRIRFNTTRGLENRGSVDHVWRVFEDDKEYLVKHVVINVPSYGSQTGQDWSMCCNGKLTLDRETSTATIELA